MRRVRVTGILLALAISACAPANLEPVRARKISAEAHEAALVRGLSGGEDAEARMALGRWVKDSHREGWSGRQVFVRTGGRLFHVSYTAARAGVYSPTYFDRLEPAGDYKVTGLKRHQVQGVGVPMIGIRENKNREPIEKWYPPEAITRAVTLVAIPGKFQEGYQNVELRLVDRMHEETVLLNGKRQSLAGDFSAPFASLLQDTGPFMRTGFLAVVQERTGRNAGFALMEPYDPNRTPLILVHGLLSTPLAWAKLTNDLWSQPLVRHRYQIWHYYYPTNAPALYSARIMRGQLDDLRHFLDPSGTDPAMQHTVVIAHSNGGLLAKTLAVNPRDAFWDVVFTRPLSSLKVTPKERATLKEAFYWKPRHHVDRIIFCSVPFRGSFVASSWIGQAGLLLTAPSHDFQDFYREVERKNPGAIQPGYASLTGGKVSSLTALTPKQKSMEILDHLPLVRGAKAHVITGKADFFVPAESSSFPGAESSLAVPGGHGSFHHERALQEILRILALP